MDNLKQSVWIIETLIQNGIREFVISPGSRSTPLTVAAARHPQARTHIHFDERGAGFFALGLAKALQLPAVLICTSGTAVANYFPAVIEASMDNIPLLVLSADRPPELIGVGANQAIFQEDIYGVYPRLAENLPPPDEHASREMIAEAMTRMIQAALGTRPGPVHLNCQFREPLLPPLKPDTAQTGEIIADPVSIIPHAPAPPPLPDLNTVRKQLESAQQGLMIIGRGISADQTAAILDLAECLNWPVFPDIQSDLRFRQHPNIINHFDLDLLNRDDLSLAPELVLHFGGAFTSKRLLQYLAEKRPHYLSVKETGERIDPNHQIDLALELSPRAFCSGIGELAGRSSESWISLWQDLDRWTQHSLNSFFDDTETLSEPLISRQLSRMLPANQTLMLGNSMPIREMEMVGDARKDPFCVIANRGASGIDGLVATAAGYLEGSQKPMTLLIGDLTLLHDLNSLALVHHLPKPLIIIVINNQGGGIFNFLPVREERDIFETHFGTPHSLDFEHAARMFGLKYQTAATSGDFEKAYTGLLANSGSAILELKTDRYANHDLHTRLFYALKQH